ncbi:MAG: hypothetical protein RLZZ518_1295 [Actinomycetota bacterium]
MSKWLSTHELRAWRGFVLNARTVLSDIEADLTEFGIDGGDYQLLAMLSEAPEHRVKLCDLASQLRLSRSGLTRRMQGVVKKGFVQRVEHASDGRSAYAELTSKGWKFVQRVAPHHVRSVRSRFVNRLSKRELSALASAFEKLGRHR